MGNKNRTLLGAEMRNKNEYYLYFDRIRELAYSRFEWSGLPNTVDVRYINKSLSDYGAVFVFKNDTDDLVALRCAPFGVPDIYGNPRFLTVYGMNGFVGQYRAEDGIVIYNNLLRTPDTRLIMTYAEQLTNLERTIDVNVKAQKHPILILCDEKRRLTLENLYANVDSNVPVIFGEKGSINLDEITCINTQAPFVAKDLQELKSQKWNELLTALGIPNISQQKKARMITDEVLRGQGGALASRYSPLTARQDSVKRINEKFGVNWSVKMREFSDEFGDETEESEVAENE